MLNDFVVCGLDMSTTSTGICIAKCNFNSKWSKELLDLLINLQPKSDPEVLSGCFEILLEDEIKWNKDQDKALKACRKKKREAEKSGESPSIEDNFMEEVLVMLRFAHQVRKIKELISPYVGRLKVILTEDYSYHSQGSVTQLAELKGAFKIELLNQYLLSRDLKYFNAPITSVKKIASTLGNSPKDVICKNMKRFGFNGYEDKDDQLDAIAISLSMFYALYYRLYGFKFPVPPNAKTKKIYQSWEKSLNTFANRIGTKEEIEEWVKK